MLRRTIEVDEWLPCFQTLPLSLQHLFPMFSATVLVEKQVDYAKARNLVLTSVVLISGAAVKLGTVELMGMALGTVVAILLSLLFYGFDRLGLSNDPEIHP